MPRHKRQKGKSAVSRALCSPVPSVKVTKDNLRKINQANMAAVTPELPPIVNNSLKVKAVTYHSYKTPLTTKEVEIPVTPGSIVKPTELLVQVKGTSINPVDCIFKGMSYGCLGPKNKIIGGDFSGIVVKAGSKTKYKPGDKIFGDILSITRRGSSSDFILFEPENAQVCELIPEGMTFEQAASLPIVSGTAYQCLYSHKGSLEGGNVLVLGSGTSVGTYAVQFAKHYFKASKVVATCSAGSTEKTKKGGADVIVDYTKGKTDKVSQILEFVKEHGKFDIIVDAVRDEDLISYFPHVLKPVSENGLFCQVQGSYTIDYSEIHIYQFLPSWKKFVSMLKYKLGFSKYLIESVLLENTKGYGDAVRTLWANRELNIPIDSVYDAYSEAQSALERVASGKSKGKVVLKF